jgi:hypothetical protein
LLHTPNQAHRDAAEVSHSPQNGLLRLALDGVTIGV